MDKMNHADPGDTVRIFDQQYLEKPFQVKFVAGKAESVAIAKDEPLWVVNFKRALLAQIQLQLDSTSGVFEQAEYENYYADNTVYHVMEVYTLSYCLYIFHI